MLYILSNKFKPIYLNVYCLKCELFLEVFSQHSLIPGVAATSASRPTRKIRCVTRIRE